MRLKTKEATLGTWQQRGKCARKPRGQVMVLGCLTMLLLALSLMMSFSVSNAVHERIRIQSHADAMAFSMAVVEARAMNYIAYSNRALAAAFVSMTTVHAYGAIATSSVSLMQGMLLAMIAAQGMEDSQCNPPFGLIHCFHARIIGFRIPIYRARILQQQMQVRQLEQPFNNAVRAFARLANEIHRSQHSMVRAAQQLISTGGKTGDFDKIRQNNAPCVEPGIPEAVGALNVRNFACAMEGSELDGEAGGSNCSGPSALDNRRRIMSNVVNAARPSFLRTLHTTSFMAPGNLGPPVFQTNFVNILMQEIPQPQVLGLGTGYRVDGWLTDGICQGANNQSKGDASCAQAGRGTAFVYIPFDVPGGGAAPNALMGSNRNGGRHVPMSTHMGHHREYKGLFANNASPPCSEGNCFINYRLDNEANHWGQPAVYAYIEQSLRDWTTQQNECNPNRQAWEINEGRTVNTPHGQRERGQLRLVPARNGVAVSKALVYFHRVDDWKFPPNLFDPYWRTKLHPFNEGESDNVLDAAGFSREEDRRSR